MQKKKKKPNFNLINYPHETKGLVTAEPMSVRRAHREFLNIVETYEILFRY